MKENMLKDNGEEDWWRREPGYIAILCGNGVHCEEPRENIHYAQLYAALFDQIHGGNLGNFFNSNTNYESFKKTCNENPEAREVCITKYKLNRLLKQTEKEVA